MTHDADERSFMVSGDKVDDLHTVLDAARQHQMPYYHAFSDKSVAYDDFGLSLEHQRDRLGSDFEVVGRGGIGLRQSRREVLKVGEIYVYKPAGADYCFGGFIASAIIDNGNGKFGFYAFQCVEYLVGEVRGSYEIYIMRALLLQRKHKIAELRLGHYLSFLAVRNISVLTKDAFERTARKEDGSAAFFAADDGLLEKMEHGKSDADLLAFAARSFAYRAVDIAFSRA